MPSPEVPLDTLLEQLDALPRGDRHAILALLSPEQREQLHARRRQGRAAEAKPASPFSPDIAARVAALDRPGDRAMTPAGHAALARLVASEPTSRPSTPASLFDAAASLLGRWTDRR